MKMKHLDQMNEGQMKQLKGRKKGGKGGKSRSLWLCGITQDYVIDNVLLGKSKCYGVFNTDTNKISYAIYVYYIRFT